MFYSERSLLVHLFQDSILTEADFYYLQNLELKLLLYAK